jgi:hypothetical protein
MTTKSVLDLIEAGKKPVTRIRVLIGESDDPTRRGDKKVVAWSDCRYYCPDRATLEKCIEHLKDSDERLRARPEDQMLWDWDTTWMQYDEPGNPNSGGMIFLGVAWYDRAFFDDRSGAWFGAMHTRLYKTIGVPLEQITVQHFLAAEQAA